MKNLTSKLFAMLLLTLPSLSWASSMQLLNYTAYNAQFVIYNGDVVIARPPGIQPGGVLQVPTNDTYEVVAQTVIDGNTYVSAPLQISNATTFTAQVFQIPSQGTYEFNIASSAATEANALIFNNTTNNTVTYTIQKDGKRFQAIVVTPSSQQRLDITNTYSIYAVINGITTETVITTNPSAIVSAVTEQSEFEWGYYTLIIQ